MNLARAGYGYGNGRDLGKLFAEIVKDSENKVDREVPVRHLQMDPEGFLNASILNPAKTGPTRLDLSDWALTQAAQKLDIPVRYLKKCPPALRASNFNEWAEKNEGTWLLRNRTGQSFETVRGVLSTDYTKFDDAQLVEIINKIFGTDTSAYDIVMEHRDDGSFHCRIAMNDLTTSVGRLRDGSPDIHKVGVHIANSEVGKRSVMVAPMVYRLVCTNGLMRWEATDDVLKLRHVNLRDYEMYNRVAEGVGIAFKVGDEMIEQLRAARETPVENPLDIIRKLSTDNKYSQKFTDEITMSYARNSHETGDNLYSLTQAFTEAAQQLNPDDRISIERDAANLLSERLVRAGV